MQEEQQYHKLHQKQVQAQQDSAWMHSVPDWHDAELVGQNKPWTVPSQLLTAEEEVGPVSVLGTPADDVAHQGAQRDRVAKVVEPGSGFRVLRVKMQCNRRPGRCPCSCWRLKKMYRCQGTVIARCTDQFRISQVAQP